MMQNVPTSHPLFRNCRRLANPAGAAYTFYAGRDGLVRLQKQFLCKFSPIWLDCQGLAECQALVRWFTGNCLLDTCSRLASMDSSQF
jgi:hypothetical protein